MTKRLLKEADHARRTALKLNREEKGQGGPEKKYRALAHGGSSSSGAASSGAAPVAPAAAPAAAAAAAIVAAPAAAARPLGVNAGVGAALAQARAPGVNAGAVNWVYQSDGKWKATSRPILIQQLQVRNNPMPAGWNDRGHQGYLTVPALRALILSRDDRNNIFEDTK